MSFETPTWVEVYGAPRRIYYARALDAGLAAGFGSGYPAHPILLGIGALSQRASDDEGPENPSTAFTLDNRNGLAAATLERPPLGARAEVKGRRRTLSGAATVVLFAGVITGISITEEAVSVTVQA